MALPVVTLALFAMTLAVLGGSSRTDPVQLIALRPLAALFLIPALYWFERGEIKRVRVLATLLVALIGWTLLQLIPLPPGLWTALAGRGEVAALDAALGLEDNWRPISMAPARGWNAAAGLIVPFAALIVALAAKANSRLLLVVIGSLGVLDAILGVAQVIDGSNSALYFYQYSNRGAPVGIFANENHSAAFSACALLVVTKLALDEPNARRRGLARVGYPAAALIIVLAALISGSRGGIIFVFFAGVTAAAMIFFASWQPGKGRRSRRKPHQESIARKRRLFVGVGILMMAFVPVIFLLFDRVPAFSDILSKDPFEDLRWEIWPALTEMINTYWLFGAGFGAFEQLYHIYEPTSLLMPKYVNQAHNDWAQLVIEGGVPTIVILVLALRWVFQSIIQILENQRTGISSAIFWVAIFSIIAFASLFDYPLRAPAFQAIGVWFLMAIGFEREWADKGKSPSKNGDV